MTEKNAPDYATWLPVIGKGLAYLCLAKATEADKTKFKDVLARVDYVQHALRHDYDLMTD
jgi:hypothetical protein